MSETIYVDTLLNDSTLSSVADGYLFDVNELKSMFDGWSALMPYFSSGIGKKEIKTLRKLYCQQCSNINGTYRRKVLSNKSSISDLFYYKIGVQSYERLMKLETQFKSGKLRIIKIAGSTYYFIPKQEMI